MNRAQLRRIAEVRVDEARALLDAGLWSGAYYLAGYAVECGPKSCVLAHVERTGAIFEDRRFSEKCWTHDVQELVKVAGLERELGLAIAGDIDLNRSWTIVKDWNEAARYRDWSEPQARDLFGAVTNTKHGVLTWIKVHW